MPLPFLGDEFLFPPPDRATAEGVVAVGGDTRPERLVHAYAQGIFPWPIEGYPLLWFSPDPRFVLEPANAHIGRSLRRRIRRGGYDVRFDHAFTEVIDHCAHAPRDGQGGTWITEELRAGYVQLHQLGLAHSIEAYRDDRLVGGLYGVSLGRVFYGESMFAREADASKVAFATLLGHLRKWEFPLVDCQVETDHLARFGASNWSRSRFLDALEEALGHPTRRGPWSASMTPLQALVELDRPVRPAA